MNSWVKVWTFIPRITRFLSLETLRSPQPQRATTPTWWRAFAKKVQIFICKNTKVKGHCKRITFTYLFPKRARYYVAHIAMNGVHDRGKYVTWCGIFVKEVRNPNIWTKNPQPLPLYIKDTRKRNILNVNWFQLGENFPCANPDMAEWSPMPGFDQTNGISILTNDVTWDGNPIYDTQK